MSDGVAVTTGGFLILAWLAWSGRNYGRQEHTRMQGCLWVVSGWIGTAAGILVVLAGIGLATREHAFANNPIPLESLAAIVVALTCMWVAIFGAFDKDTPLAHASYGGAWLFVFCFLLLAWAFAYWVR